MGLMVLAGVTSREGWMVVGVTEAGVEFPLEGVVIIERKRCGLTVDGV